MAKTWILVANGSEARLFRSTSHITDIELVDSFTHAESRMKGSELASDRPGHFMGDSGNGAAHGAFNEPVDPKEYEKERFAINLAKTLDSARATNQYNNLIVVAPAQFRGMLNKHLSKHCSQLVSKQLDKDYTSVRELDMSETLRGQLGP